MARKETPKEIWVASNRQDNRLVLWERDDRHPSGEAFVGGDSVALVYPTPAIERLLQEGQIVTIQEPPDEIDGKPNRKKPRLSPRLDETSHADPPGKPIRLGRAFDPAIVPPNVVAEVKEDLSLRRIPKEIPVPAGVIIPPPLASERDSSR